MQGNCIQQRVAGVPGGLPRANSGRPTASNKGLLGSQSAFLSLLAANLGISIHLVSKHPGSYYGPYFVADWTTGTYANYPTRARTTIYYTLDTFDPYGQ